MKVGVTALGPDFRANQEGVRESGREDRVECNVPFANCGFRLVHDSTGPDRGYRGGSWVYWARNACVAIRDRSDPAGRVGTLGFRLVRATEQG